MVLPVAGLNYKNFLHGHSHLAFLGWIFNALFVALLFAYLPGHRKKYRLLFWLLQVAVVGMLISFPIQGYAAVSITFSTLHILLSYLFAAKFLRDVRQQEQQLDLHQPSLRWVKWGLGFMVLSSLGPFALGAIMAKGLAGTPLYQLAIYFYLHFQYNGWFTFAVFGLFFWLLERNGIGYNLRYGRNFLGLMAATALAGFALSTLWVHPPAWVFGLGAVAAAAQVVAGGYFLRLFLPLRKSLGKALSLPVRGLLLLAGLALALKIILQTASALPAVADLAYLFRNFTIGYLHLVFLGFVSIFLFGWFAWVGWLDLHRRQAKWGFGLFMAGFVGSQLYVVGQPLLAWLGLGLIPHYYLTLLLLSLLMPLGLSLLLFTNQSPPFSQHLGGKDAATEDDASKKNQKISKSHMRV
jgi:hypothetical protein